MAGLEDFDHLDPAQQYFQLTNAMLKGVVRTLVWYKTVDDPRPRPSWSRTWRPTPEQRTRTRPSGPSLSRTTSCGGRLLVAKTSRALPASRSRRRMSRTRSTASS